MDYETGRMYCNAYFFNPQYKHIKITNDGGLQKINPQFFSAGALHVQPPQYCACTPVGLQPKHGKCKNVIREQKEDIMNYKKDTVKCMAEVHRAVGALDGSGRGEQQVVEGRAREEEGGAPLFVGGKMLRAPPLCAEENNNGACRGGRELQAELR